ncbi:alkaline phosphatase-like [Haliotis rufescens]|uniref:alkaline phosphatase-like n=1 Tax=Haliotis rufescens TaxID=6454 RepID=UPI00201F7E27|nr:alkaline phosphatase-like [Haliotis rufescens]
MTRHIINTVTMLQVIFVCMYFMAKGTCQNEAETLPSYWNDVAAAELLRAKALKPIEKPAKNIILFVGDGMGITTTFAARVLKGQLRNASGEETLLSFEEFPYVGMSRTYSIDKQTTDSASTATAILSGIKNNFGALGVDGRVKQGDCPAALQYNVTSIADWAMAAGKSVGIVTTTRVTHGTPAAAYAHSADRNWEGDSEMTSVTGGCSDIAKQLVDDNPDIKVILGGGRQYFRPIDAIDPETGTNDTSNGRRDGRDLVEDWMENKAERNATHRYVWNLAEFNEVDPESVDFLLGLFSNSHMNYEIDRRDGPTGNEAGEPSLSQMTEKAIQILQRDPDGFFLLVEGGRIDHGHHASRAAHALYDTVAFEEAVTTATEITSEDDTLTVVTADHSHVLTVGGYADRGNPILGKSGSSGSDGLPYTSLLYGNGPGYDVVDNGGTFGRPNLTDTDTEERLYRQQSAVPLDAETHGGEDVGIYAQGPMAHLFHGVHQENYIAHVMAYAGCIGAYRDSGQCAQSEVTTPPVPPRSGATANEVCFLLFVVIIGLVF